MDGALGEAPAGRREEERGERGVLSLRRLLGRRSGAEGASSPPRLLCSPGAWAAGRALCPGSCRAPPLARALQAAPRRLPERRALSLCAPGLRAGETRAGAAGRAEPSPPARGSRDARVGGWRESVGRSRDESSRGSQAPLPPPRPQLKEKKKKDHRTPPGDPRGAASPLPRSPGSWAGVRSSTFNETFGAALADGRAPRPMGGRLGSGAQGPAPGRLARRARGRGAGGARASRAGGPGAVARARRSLPSPSALLGPALLQKEGTSLASCPQAAPLSSPQPRESRNHAQAG